MRLLRLPRIAGDVSPRPKLWRLGLIAALVAATLTIVGMPSGERVTPAAAATGSGIYVFGATSGTALTHPLSSGTNPHFNWADLEPSEGRYNWAALDKALSDASKAGRTVVPRVFTNRSSQAQASPAWFFSTRNALSYYPAGTSKKAPVAWDPVFQDKFGNFLEALGARYDGNSAIEFFQITGVGVYGEMYLGGKNPAGYSVDKLKGAIRYWTDAWASAFPSTHLGLTVNALGANIGEGGAQYAVSRGFYLQMNSPSGNSATRAILAAHDTATKIVIEAENGGCRDATGPGFVNLMNTVFSYGYDVHYAILCNHSFITSNAQPTLSSTQSRLNHGGGTASAPTPTPTARVTSTPTPRVSAPAATATRQPATATPRASTPTPTPRVATPTPRPSQPTPTPTARPWWWYWLQQ